MITTIWLYAITTGYQAYQWHKDGGEWRPMRADPVYWIPIQGLNSLVPGRSGNIWTCVLWTHILGTCEIAPRWMLQKPINFNMGSGNGLMLVGNKPLPEPMVTQLSVTIWSHQPTINTFKNIVAPQETWPLKHCCRPFNVSLPSNSPSWKISQNSKTVILKLLFMQPETETQIASLQFPVAQDI